MNKYKNKRKKNLKMQMHKIIDSLLRIGESKYLAKKEYRAECEANNEKWNPSKSKYIHSIKTVDLYRDTINLFSEYLKQEEIKIWNSKDLSKLNKQVCYRFLSKKDQEESAYSTSRHMAALNKVLGLGLTKKEGKLKKRSYKNITRVRNIDKKSSYNSKNYKKQLLIAKAFGLRRESIVGGDFAVKEKSLFWDKDSDKILCGVIEKGGKYREAVCLDKYSKEVSENFIVKERRFDDKKSFKKIYSETDNELLFEKYTEKIRNHAIRRIYAKELYNQLLCRENRENKNKDVKHRGYNYKALKKVSKALGHNRVDVVVEHYLK